MNEYKYYRLLDGSVMALKADGSQDSFLPQGAVLMTPEEVELHLNPPVVISGYQVDAERDRRINAGFVFGGKEYDLRSDKDDFQNMSMAAQIADRAVQEGFGEGNLRWADKDKDFYWIAKDNSMVNVDAPTMLKLFYAAAAWKTRHIYAARNIKSMNPIPMDYTSDSYWS